MGYNSTKNSTDKSIGSVFLLPNGKVWNGPVHKMSDETWMTGNTHSKSSVALYLMESFIDYPEQDKPASKEPLDDVFNFIAEASDKNERNIVNLSSSIIELERSIDTEHKIAEGLLTKLEQFKNDSSIQLEHDGAGSIVDQFDTPLTLSTTTTLDNAAAISTIEFIPDNDANTSIYFGNIETGAEGLPWTNVATSNITADMLSRRNIAIDEVQSDNETSFTEEFRSIPLGYSVGFSGDLNITFGSEKSINKIRINKGSDVVISNIRFNNEDVDQLNGNTYTEVLNVDSTKVNSVKIRLDYMNPVPFSSYAHINEDGIVTDLLGDFVSDYNLNFTGSNAIYQRSRMNIGPIFLLAESYGEQTEIVSDVYTCNNGNLSSLFLLSSEDIPLSFVEGTYIDYFLLINGEEYPIVPQNLQGDKPSKYYINSPASEEARQSMVQTENAGFIDTESTINWQIKYVLKRPVSSSFSTPSIKGVNFYYTTTNHEGLF